MEEQEDSITREDVEVVEEAAPVISARERLLDEIDARREDSIKADNLNQLEEAGLVPAPVEPVPSTPTLVKVKVDGQEMEVPYEEVIANFQKTQYADKKMQEAALERQNVERQRQELEALREQITQTQTKAPEKPVEAKTDIDPALTIREAVDRLMEGDAESAVEQFSKLMNQPKVSTPELDEAKIMQAVEHKMSLAKYNDELTKANELFLSEYEDLNADPTLLTLVNMKYDELLNSGVNPVQAAKTAGNATREWMQSKTGSPATVNTAERQALKQNITAIPQASARTKSTHTDEPDDTSSVIAGMRRGRPSQNF